MPDAFCQVLFYFPVMFVLGGATCSTFAGFGGHYFFGKPPCLLMLRCGVVLSAKSYLYGNKPLGYDRKVSGNKLLNRYGFSWDHTSALTSYTSLEWQKQSSWDRRT